MTVNSTLINLSKLYGLSGSLKQPRGLYKGGSRVKRAYKGSTMVWDQWDTTLTADTSFAIEANEQSTASFIDVYSYGVDYDKKQYALDYTISPATISKNTASTQKTHTVTITQTRTSSKITATVTQEGNKQSTISYSTPTVISIIVDEVPASGGTAYAYANYQQTKTTHYTNGDTVNETLQGQITATILGGTKGEGVTTLTNGAIKVESAYTTPYTDKRLVYTVSKIGFTVNNKYVESSAQVGIYQDENARSSSPTSYGSWVVDCSHYNGVTTNIAATGGTMQVVVNSYRTNVYTWTSGSTENVTQYGTGTITSSNIASLSATSFTGKSGGVLITATVDENPTKNQRTCTVSITSNSISKSASRIQNASVFALSATPPLVGHAGGNATLQIVSTRNSKAFKPSVSVSGIANASVVSITLATDVPTTGLYYCVISFPANGNSTSRTLTATITQSGGNSTTSTITQSGKPAYKAFFDGTFNFRMLGTSISYNVVQANGVWSAVGDKYGGGTLDNVTVTVLQSDKTSVVSTKTLSGITVPDEGTAASGMSTGLTGSKQAAYVRIAGDGLETMDFVIGTSSGGQT